MVTDSPRSIVQTSATDYSLLPDKLTSIENENFYSVEMLEEVSIPLVKVLEHKAIEVDISQYTQVQF